MRPDKRASLKRLLSNWQVWGIAALLVASGLAPGPWWPYLAAAAVWVLLLARRDYEWVHAGLSLLASIFPPVQWALSYERLQQDFREVVAGMERTLSYFSFKQASLTEADREALCSRPPRENQDDLLKVCCGGFEKRIESHPPAQVLELLYRYLHEQTSAGIWGTISSDDELKRKLAGILVNSQRLPALDDAGPQDMEALVVRTLDLLPMFDLRVVEDELRSWKRLWAHLTGYGDYLRAESAGEIEAKPGVKDLTRAVGGVIPGKLLTGEYNEAAEKALLGISREWVCGWAKDKGLSGWDAENLAVLGLGIFSSEHEATGRALLAGFGDHVAGNSDALDMLLAYLWNRSRLATSPTHGFGHLALHWTTWRNGAATEMGPGLCPEVCRVLAADLRKGAWPTELPVQRSIAEILRTSQQNHDDLMKVMKARKKTPPLLKKIDELYQRVSGTGQPLNHNVPLEDLQRVVQSAVEANIRQLSPPTAGKAPDTAQKLEKNLESFAGRYRPEIPPAGHPEGDVKSVAAMAALHERAASLGLELEEISERLLAEAGGARGYIITFDQSRGGLAEVIDDLKKDHGFGFEHYTRYSRIGVLQEGETFEEFYRSFLGKLEERLQAEIDEDPAHWEQIEITVQPISLSHRHDFATDAEKDGKVATGVIRKLVRAPLPIPALASAPL